MQRRQDVHRPAALFSVDFWPVYCYSDGQGVQNTCVTGCQMLFFAFQRFMPAPASGMIVKMEEKMKNERNTETGNDNIKSAGSSPARCTVLQVICSVALLLTVNSKAQAQLR